MMDYLNARSAETEGTLVPPLDSSSVPASPWPQVAVYAQKQDWHPVAPSCPEITALSADVP